MPKPLIHIEAVQFTPGRDPVMVHYTGKGIESGPLAKSSIFSTTQTALAGVEPGADPESIVWGDSAVVTALEAHLAENGIAATVALPEPDPVETAGGVLEAPIPPKE